MNLERLIGALHGAETDLHVEDLLDAFWLATRGRSLSLHEIAPLTGPIGAPPPSPDIEDQPPPADATDAAAAEESRPSEPGQPPPADETTPVYASGRTDDAGATVKASPVAVPAGHALSGRLQLSRALRPFRQRWPSRHEQELDEERTAEITAELHGRMHPVFRPVQEPWYDVDVVLEDDPAIGVWRDTLRDFCQMLRDTGAFRDVRSWRLRMPALAAPGSLPPPRGVLESAGGSQISAQAFGGQGLRRLIFFATHGSSTRWLDGGYARVLSPWVHGSSVVLMHLLDRDDWKRSPLGEPHGLCIADDPGAITSTLRVERFPWMDDRSAARCISIPAVPLTPEGLQEWSHMQMARGRRCPVFLVDVDARATADPPAESEQEFERNVALLDEASHDAFRLAVYLSSGPFTIPVARLVQEAKFGPNARQQDLAEVLLSGLVFARTQPQASRDTDEIYYDFYPPARTILTRSLRDDDAELIAGVLEKRVSQYIEKIYGRSITLRALVADENGKYDLPQWAQPFARLGVSLLGTSPTGKSPAQLLREFRSAHRPAVVARAAELARSTLAGAELQPGSVDADLWDALLASQLVRRQGDGRWSFLPGVEPLLLPIALNELLSGVRILWVDDHAENNRNEIAHFESLGAGVDLATDTETAMQSFRGATYDIILSDMGRGMDERAGFDLLQQLAAATPAAPPVIIYTAGFGADGLRREEAVRAGAFACTNVSAALLDLILFATGRRTRPPAIKAGEVQVLHLLKSYKLDFVLGVTRFIWSPQRVAEEILGPLPPLDGLDEGFKELLRRHLTAIQVFSGSNSNYVFRLDGEELRRTAAVLDSQRRRALYDTASWDGVIGRAARTRQRTWVPDVSLDPDYIAAEPDTQSELALPLVHDNQLVGVVNIEMPRRDALEEVEIRWLEEFCAPLAARLVMLRESDEPAQQEESVAPLESPGPEAPAPRRRLSETGTDDYAIVVAIDQSPHLALPQNANTEQNARLLIAWLKDPAGGGLPATNVSVLFGEQATTPNLMQVLRATLDRAPATRRLYLYFATHVWRDRDSWQPMTYIPESGVRAPEGLLDLQAYLEAIQRSGIREWVLAIETPSTAVGPKGEVPTVAPILPPSGQPLSFFAFNVRDPGSTSSEPPLAESIVKALRAAADSAGNVTSRSLGEYLRAHSSVHYQSTGDIVFRVQRFGVLIFGHGTVQARDASGAVVAESVTNEGSCHLWLPAGRYRIEYAGSRIGTEVEVRPGTRSVEVHLGVNVDADVRVYSQRGTISGPKELVLLFDGTWNAVTENVDGPRQSNVARFRSSLRGSTPGRPTQVTYYHSSSATGLNRLMGGFIGAGMKESLQNGYRYLVEHYTPGDRLSVFGFSRGAYVALNLVAVLNELGVLRHDQRAHLEDAFALIRDVSPEKRAKFGELYCSRVPVAFLGLWEAVNAPGILGTFGSSSSIEGKLPPIVEKACHALAIDETRAAFRPMMLSDERREVRHLEQRWFVGTHSDVGGGHAEHELADLSLQWMQHEAVAAGLGIDPDKVVSISERHFRGPIHASSVTMALASRPRPIGTTAHGHEVVDPSAMERYERDAAYRPRNLVEYIGRLRP